jgi:hypothetical protein
MVISVVPNEAHRLCFFRGWKEMLMMGDVIVGTDDR